MLVTGIFGWDVPSWHTCAHSWLPFQEYADKNGFLIFETSAKSGDNVQELFVAAAMKASEKVLLQDATMHLVISLTISVIANGIGTFLLEQACRNAVVLCLQNHIFYKENSGTSVHTHAWMTCAMSAQDVFMIVALVCTGLNATRICRWNNNDDSRVAAWLCTVEKPSCWELLRYTYQMHAHTHSHDKTITISGLSLIESWFVELMQQQGYFLPAFACTAFHALAAQSALRMEILLSYSIRVCILMSPPRLHFLFSCLHMQ